MRNAGDAAGFQHAEAERHGGDLIVGIEDPHPPRPQQSAADEAGRHRGREQPPEERIKDRSGHRQEAGGSGSRILAKPLRRFGDVPPRLRKAEQRKNGYEDGPGIEKQRRARKPGFRAQPEIDAEASVQPGDDEGDGLTGTDVGIEDPEVANHFRVAGIMPGQGPFDPGPDHMGDQEEGQAHA